MIEEQNSAQGARICPQCGAAFTCGIAAGGSSMDELGCWCFDFPAVMPVRADTACLCPACLTQAVRQVQASQISPKEKP